MTRVRGSAASAACAVALVLLGACSSTTSNTTPTWVPSPPFDAAGEGPGVQLTPIIAVPSPRSGGGNGSLTPSRPRTPSSSSGTTQDDPDVVATNLSAPVGLTLLPDGSALVGERRSGRIVQVQPEPDQPVPLVRTLSGLDTAGDGGLLDLALSPTYDEDNLIYAYITTPEDNRVVDFTLSGPITPVLTGIPRGSTDNTGRIAFDADGDLFVGTGDAGSPALAADPRSLAGKVLRLNSIGRPAQGNPDPASPVWTNGHRVVDGLCAVPKSDMVLEAEAGAGTRADRVNVLQPGGYYGWPLDNERALTPLTTLPAADRAPGGCAVGAGALWVTSLDGRALLGAKLPGTGGSGALGPLHAVLHGTYGRLRTVVAAPDGALWLTTSNRDGHGSPVADDERVIRYVPPTGGTPNDS